MDRAEVEKRLAGFAGHLLKNRLADEKHGRYMVGWVRRFLASSPPVPNATPGECLQAFLRELEKERHEPWQVEQARQSVVAWFAWRRGQEDAPAEVKLALAADRTADPSRALETTMIYTHVAKGLRAPPKSPLDQLR